MKSNELICVLGASGFIGRHVLESSRLKNSTCWGIDIQQLPDDCAIDRFILLDLGNSVALRGILEEIESLSFQRIVIIHLAAYYDFNNKKSSCYQDIYQATEQMLRWSVETEKKVDWVFSSSMAAMQSSTQNLLTEESPRSEKWQYPKSKVALEKLFDQYCQNLQIYELVLAGVYSDYCELVPLYFHIERLSTWSLEKYFFPGDPHCGLSYLHIEDGVQAIEKCLSIDRGPGKHRFLIGQSTPMAYQEICNQVTQGSFSKPIKIPKWLAILGSQFLTFAFGLFGKRRFIKAWMIPFADENYHLDISKAQRILHWQPTRHLRDDLSLLLRNRTEDKQKWTILNRNRPW